MLYGLEGFQEYITPGPRPNSRCESCVLYLLHASVGGIITCDFCNTHHRQGVYASDLLIMLLRLCDHSGEGLQRSPVQGLQKYS